MGKEPEPTPEEIRRAMSRLRREFDALDRADAVTSSEEKQQGQIWDGVVDGAEQRGISAPDAIALADKISPRGAETHEKVRKVKARLLGESEKL